MTHVVFPKRIAKIPRTVRANPVSMKATRLALDAFEKSIQEATTHFYGHGRKVESHRELLARSAINARTKLLNYIGYLEKSQPTNWRDVARAEVRRRSMEAGRPTKR